MTKMELKGHVENNLQRGNRVTTAGSVMTVISVD